MQPIDRSFDISLKMGFGKEKGIGEKIPVKKSFNDSHIDYNLDSYHSGNENEVVNSGLDGSIPSVSTGDVDDMGSGRTEKTLLELYGNSYRQQLEVGVVCNEIDSGRGEKTLSEEVGNSRRRQLKVRSMRKVLLEEDPDLSPGHEDGVRVVSNEMGSGRTEKALCEQLKVRSVSEVGEVHNEMGSGRREKTLREVFSKSRRRQLKVSSKRKMLPGEDLDRSPRQGNGVGLVYNEMHSNNKEKALVDIYVNTDSQQLKRSSKKTLLLEEDPDWSPRQGTVVSERWSPRHNLNQKHSVEGEYAADVLRPVVLALAALSSNTCILGENKKIKQSLRRVVKSNKIKQSLKRVVENDKIKQSLKRVVGDGGFVPKPVIQALPALGGKWSRNGLIVSKRESYSSEHFLEEYGVVGVSNPTILAMPASYSLKDLFSLAGWTLRSPKGASTPTYISPSGSVYESPSKALEAFSLQSSKFKQYDWSSVQSVDSYITCFATPAYDKKGIPKKTASISEPIDPVKKADADSQQYDKLQGAKRSVGIGRKGVPIGRKFNKQMGSGREVTLKHKVIISEKGSHKATEVEAVDYKLNFYIKDECSDHEKNSSGSCSVVMTKKEENSKDEVHYEREVQGLRRSNRINGRHVPVDYELVMEMFDAEYVSDTSNSADILKPEEPLCKPESYNKETDKEFSPSPERMRTREVYELMEWCVAKGKTEFCNSEDKMVQNFPPSVHEPYEENDKEDSSISDYTINRVSKVVTLSMEDERGDSCIEDGCLSNEITLSDRSSSIVINDQATENDMNQDGSLAEIRSPALLNERDVPVDGEIDIGTWEVDDSTYSSNSGIAKVAEENQTATVSPADSYREPPTSGDILLKQAVTDKLDIQKPENQKQLESNVTPCKVNSSIKKFDGIKTPVSMKCSLVSKKGRAQSQKNNKWSPRKRKSVIGGGSPSGKKKRKRSGACGLMVRRTGRAGREENTSFETKINILSWLIDIGIVVENEKVVYNTVNGKSKMLKGCVTRGGIRCKCCTKVLPLLEFEAHAGSNLRQPWNSTCLTSGKSLMQCQSEAWEKEKKQKKIGFQTVGVGVDTDPSDDTCAVCADGGHMICCDGCPSTFHPECLMLKSLPEGSWYCSFCTCTYCMLLDCGEDKCSGTMNLLSCKQCGCKYHVDCVCDNDLGKRGWKSLAYCGKNCEKMDSSLSQIFGFKNPIEGSFAWTLLRRREEVVAAGSDEWNSYIIEGNVKLSLALVVLYECFVPLLDYRTGLDMIAQAVYSCGSNFKRLNYEGFYTIILEEDEDIVSVATLRIHGTHVAEMPFIGTRPMYRRRGMCRRLLHAIEEMLWSLQVERLIIPAVPEMKETWMTSFCFKQLEASHRDEIRNLNMVLFAETTLLQKPIYNDFGKQFDGSDARQDFQDASVRSSEEITV